MGVKSKRLRFEILKRDGFRCRYCGATADESTLHVDHIFPEAKGGKDRPDNLVAACEDCNLGKSDITIFGESDIGAEVWNPSAALADDGLAMVLLESMTRYSFSYAPMDWKPLIRNAHGVGDLVQSLFVLQRAGLIQIGFDNHGFPRVLITRHNTYA